MMESKRICPAEIAGGLDNSIRRLLQNPQKILKPYIHSGMTVLDLGCGPGFFTVEIAKLLKGSGKVIAADLQEEMLEKLRRKITGIELEQRIILHKCQNEPIGITEKVDFVLAFYMVHEVPNLEKLFQELQSILTSDARIFIVEPNFHVTGKSFDTMLECAKSLGFEIANQQKSFFNRAVVLSLKKD